MANLSSLDAAVTALTAQVERTEGVEASAIALLQGFAQEITKAVDAALAEDNAADEASVIAANEAIAAVTARFSSSSEALSAALEVNNPPVE